MVDLMGFEPMSPNLKGWCYTNLATGTYKIFNFFYLFFWRELCYLYTSNLSTKKPDIFICPVSFVLSKEYDFSIHHKCKTEQDIGFIYQYPLYSLFFICVFIFFSYLFYLKLKYKQKICLLVSIEIFRTWRLLNRLFRKTLPTFQTIFKLVARTGIEPVYTAYEAVEWTTTLSRNDK